MRKKDNNLPVNTGIILQVLLQQAGGGCPWPWPRVRSVCCSNGPCVERMMDRFVLPHVEAPPSTELTYFSLLCHVQVGIRFCLKLRHAPDVSHEQPRKAAVWKRSRSSGARAFAAITVATSSRARLRLRNPPVFDVGEMRRSGAGLCCSGLFLGLHVRSFHLPQIHLNASRARLVLCGLVHSIPRLHVPPLRRLCTFLFLALHVSCPKALVSSFQPRFRRRHVLPGHLLPRRSTSTRRLLSRKCAPFLFLSGLSTLCFASLSRRRMRVLSSTACGRL